MLSASWCIVRRNGHHDDGKVLLLRCFLLLSCHHVLHSRIRRCLQRPAPHVEAVVQARKKKVLFHGLLQRVHPRLVGSSRKKRKLDQSSPQQSRRKCVWTYLKLLPSFVRISTRTHFTHHTQPNSRSFFIDMIQKAQPRSTRSHGDLHDLGGKALRAARRRDAPPREQAAMAATSSDGFPFRPGIRHPWHAKAEVSPRSVRGQRRKRIRWRDSHHEGAVLSMRSARPALQKVLQTLPPGFSRRRHASQASRDPVQRI